MESSIFTYMALGKLTLTTPNLILSSIKWEKYLLYISIMGINEIMHLKILGQCMSPGKHSVHIF